MSDQPRRVVIFLLDRTGSMERIKSSTMEAFNGYVAELKHDPQIEFTLVQFDTISIDVVHRRVPIGEVPDLSTETFRPRGGTPLIDAACVTIKAAQAEYAASDRVVVTILTDGHENASTEFKMSDLHALTREMTAAGWEFIFLGASIDAYADAGRMGVSVASTVSYDSSDRQAALSTLSRVSMKTREFFLDGRKVGFTEDEKDVAGDRFRPEQSAVDRLKF